MNPPYILCIETGTDICSVALTQAGNEACPVTLRESSDERDHARRIAVYTEEVLAEAGIKASDLSAVAVSKGPGSYTGLRIGVSFAKGLCYGLGIPLIGVDSLESLCQMAIASLSSASADQTGMPLQTRSSTLLIPMIDARRMEVFCRIFDADGRSITETEALIIEDNSLSEYRTLATDPGIATSVHIFGSGAEKCRDILLWTRYLDVRPSAKGMLRLAAKAFFAKDFENTAYFEPFYLKDFIITTSKKRLF